MAEERIKRYIVIDDPKIPKESDPYIYIFLSENFGEKTYMNHLPRQEAIGRMAKAQFSLMWQNKYSWENAEDEDKKSFYKSAEAALNALLEDK